MQTQSCSRCWCYEFDFHRDVRIWSDTAIFVPLDLFCVKCSHIFGTRYRDDEVAHDHTASPLFSSWHLTWTGYDKRIFALRLHKNGRLWPPHMEGYGDWCVLYFGLLADALSHVISTSTTRTLHRNDLHFLINYLSGSNVYAGINFHDNRKCDLFFSQPAVMFSLPLQKRASGTPMNTVQYHSVPLDHSMMFE